MESSSEEYGSVSEIEELSKRIEQLGRNTPEGFGSIPEIEELSKRIELLGRHATENYTPVDSRCISVQPSNLENCTFSSADRTKQHHGSDKIPISILPGSELTTEKHEGMNELHIWKGKADDKISCPISRMMLLKDTLKGIENKFHCITSEYKSNPKNPNKAGFLREIIKLQNNVLNLMKTTILARAVDSRSIGGQPGILMNDIFSYADGLKQHHKGKIPVIRDKCEWKPYHKLTGHERRDQWHIKRAEARNRLWKLNSLFPLECPLKPRILENRVDLILPSIPNSLRDQLECPFKPLILENQVDGTLPTIPNSLRLKHEKNDINSEDKVDKNKIDYNTLKVNAIQRI